jgi:hypothetical protein
MIRYSLICSDGHEFEAWFRSSGDFDDQSRRGLLTCPQCGSASVAKALMAPQVVLRETPRPALPAPAPPAPAMPAALIPPEAAELIGKLREFKAKLLENSENVGARFADEARKIHYGEAPERAVYGQASIEEARELVDEGIGIMPLPVLPDERN